MPNLILSAFADEYTQDFRAQCEALCRFGIAHIELRFVNGKNVSVLTESEVREVKALLDASGIRVSAIGSPLGKIRLNENFSKHMDTAKRVLETACVLDTEYIRIFSFYLPEGKNRMECREQVLENLEKLLSIAEPYGVCLCHENEALIYGESPESCLELLTHFRGRLGCVFDMGNFVLDGYDALSAYELLKPYITYFHIKDALSAGAIVPAGQGEAKIREILSAYRESGKPDTFITLEPHLETFSGLNALVGRSFDNPYKYPDGQTAFADAVSQLRGLL